MSVATVVVEIDLGERLAKVSRNCTEKYARKLLQDKLKLETPYKGGWNCWLLNKDWSAPEGYPNTEKYSVKGKFGRTYTGNGISDPDNYVFELSNAFASMEGYI